MLVFHVNIQISITINLYLITIENLKVLWSGVV